MKRNIMNTKYIWLLLTLIAFTACDSDDDSTDNSPEPLPALTAGEADFSNYVAVGNSLTAGFTDNALFIAGQQNSISNILATQFSLAGGGSFSMPLMSDNTGGVLFGGNQILDNRLVFDGSGPVSLEELIGPVSPTTDLAVNNPAGPFNNMGVPGAKSFHLLFDGYGNPGGLLADPPTANPFFVRMASGPTATVLGDAMDQSPSFFSLWTGNNDVLGYATSGGDGTDPITDIATFTGSFNLLITTLTSGGAQGVVGNIPDIKALPHFTTVPYAPLDPTNPDFGPQIPTLNTVFGALKPIFDAIDPSRNIVFSETSASAVVINDESLVNIGPQITGALNASETFPLFVQQFGLPAEAAPDVAVLLGAIYGQSRQATEDDLLLLPSSSIIGTVNTDTFAYLQTQGLPAALAGQFSVEGVTKPLDDKWVLIPSEQDEISSATAAFNAVIKDAVDATGVAFLDANALMNQIASSGIPSGDFILTAALVQGGAFSLDGVHPTARGNALIANEFLKAIDVTYGSNFEASGNLLNIGNFPTSYPATLP